MLDKQREKISSGTLDRLNPSHDQSTITIDGTHEFPDRLR